MEEESHDAKLAAQALKAGASEELVLALMNKKEGEGSSKRAKRKRRESMVLAVFVYIVLSMYVFFAEPFSTGEAASEVLSVGFTGVSLILVGEILYRLPRAWGARNYRHGNQRREYPKMVFPFLGWVLIWISVLSVLTASIV